jgi:hypothetical protein
MKTFQQTCQIIITKNCKLFGVLFMVLFIQSCIKEEYDKVEHKTNYYYLTTAQLNQTPYFTNPTFDTISFASNKGDTLTFVKTQTDTTWYCEKGWGTPNTGYDKDCYQTIHNTYATVKGNGSFDVKLKYKGESAGLFLLDINFNNRLFAGINNISIGVKSPTDYFDNLILNGKSFEKVIKLGYINCNLYINNRYGLFKLDYFNENSNWMHYK